VFPSQDDEDDDIATEGCKRLVAQVGQTRTSAFL
jgi:hypothetical protein